MGKCDVCEYHHPHPGKEDARERARVAGDEESWRLYLDTDTLESLQTAELAKSGANTDSLDLKGKDIKLSLSRTPQQTQEDRLDSLTQRVNLLTDQLQGFLSLQSQPVPQPAAQSTTTQILTPSITTMSGTVTLPYQLERVQGHI